MILQGHSMNDLSSRKKTETDRRRFLAALGLFFLWVAALTTMSVLSGRRPSPSRATIENG
ncbi:MAG: hypothetical protein NVSMB9_01460 [Isosphaeraceae bacterium]